MVHELCLSHPWLEAVCSVMHGQVHSGHGVVELREVAGLQDESEALQHKGFFPLRNTVAEQRNFPQSHVIISTQKYLIHHKPVSNLSLYLLKLLCGPISFDYF